MSDTSNLATLNRLHALLKDFFKHDCKSCNGMNRAIVFEAIVKHQRYVVHKFLYSRVWRTNDRAATEFELLLDCPEVHWSRDNLVVIWGFCSDRVDRF